MVIYFKFNAFRQTLPDPHLKAAANILKTSILYKVFCGNFHPISVHLHYQVWICVIFYTFPYLIVLTQSPKLKFICNDDGNKARHT